VFACLGGGHDQRDNPEKLPRFLQRDQDLLIMPILDRDGRFRCELSRAEERADTLATVQLLNRTPEHRARGDVPQSSIGLVIVLDSSLGGDD
jgi:hypothetical protein